MLRVSLVLGVLFALLWGMNVLWRRFTQPPPPPPGPKKVKIIIAERDIPAHTVITAMMLREEERMPSEAPPHTFRRIDDVINRVAKVDIYRGTPVLEDDVSEPINIEGLSVLIPDGYVAATLPINNEALYRILKTGDHIRVVATFGGLLTQTLVEDAVVLGVDTQVMNIELAQRGQPSQQEGKGKEQPQPPPSLRVLLILVRPEEAERIALAMAQPQITIDFTLLPAEPPVPTPPPPEIEGVQRKPKRGITAAELHPAVARIVAKEAGMEPEEVE
ncbi:TPA: Flp pilus assembly protein CpaB, partial [Candidatus Bipolaricaulota bacterium]|nr:Flp pilus assembly protein CpaB [Candidatus Bipolaricaulota bacterium]